MFISLRTSQDYIFLNLPFNTFNIRSSWIYFILFYLILIFCSPDFVLYDVASTSKFLPLYHHSFLIHVTKQVISAGLFGQKVATQMGIV